MFHPELGLDVDHRVSVEGGLSVVVLHIDAIASDVIRDHERFVDPGTVFAIHHAGSLDVSVASQDAPVVHGDGAVVPDHGVFPGRNEK